MMQAENFLIDALSGRLNPECLLRLREFPVEEITREVIRRYAEITDKFPADVLDQRGAIPAEAIEELKAMGFFGLSIPTAYGGLGLVLAQYLKAVEEIVSRSMSLGFTALAHLSIGTKGIVLYGTESQKRKYLPPAASGEMIFSYALTEPRTGSDARNIQSFARLSADGRHYILNGQKTYITNANLAGGLTVFAQLDPDKPGYMGAFIVETGWPGVKVGKDMPKMGLKASSTAAIQFKDVRVPRENLLGRPGDGFKIAMVILNHGRLALGAGSTGMLRQSQADMRKRAASRRQFGMPINRFELIQEKMVRAAVNGFVTSAITMFTAELLEKDPVAPVAVESSHTKLFGTTRAWDTLYDAMQTAGGSGYLSTHPYEKRMRDFRVTTIFEGTTEIHSIYPALFMLRRLAAEAKAAASSPAGRAVFLIRGLLIRFNWPLRFHHRQMDRALRLARSLARRVHLLLNAGLLIYGKRIFEREFFLRRISTLSLYAYGILAALAAIQAGRKAGRSVEDDLRLLGYFTEEARLVRRQNAFLHATRLELQGARIARELIGH
jgi:acyl-CoA dehydrogenase family protein 9